ncbi:MAG TPA: UDP-N-acetylglucosamine--N-acetylmuramyl-(pentapeptide) pyrophosphoryl-undecaprenol N-acetylglucosamine transferase, partial [Candidatus Paceibacterota bacterium]
MKILLTGGGTGGHFYPIIAIAEALYDKAKERKVLQPKLYFMSPSRYNPRALFDNDIEYVYVPAGKYRRYFSILNFTDLFKTLYGVILAIIKMYRIYPDVVFGKGGYTSFPALFAARLLHIPVVIHESDSSPGIVNKWASKFAKKIAISYPGSAKYFTKRPKDGPIDERIAFTGLPIRRGVKEPLVNGAREFLHLENETPVIVILGGSQGSQNINDIIMDALPELVKRYEIIHQTGRNNYESIKNTAKITLENNPDSYHYHPFDYLNDLALSMAVGIGSVIISRAGSVIFEIANWGIPSIIIPLPKDVSHDQVDNAFSYARTGACVVM